MKRSLMAGLVVGLSLAIARHLVLMLLWGNLHPVIEGSVYRSAQPTTTQLEQWINEHGIRTVINLRGRFTPFDRHDAELATVHRLGVEYHELNLCALRLPMRKEVLDVVAVLDASPRPLLFHCESGGDRSGLVSGMTLLLYTDSDVAAARGQLHLFYGHFPLDHRRRSLSKFFRLYENWLSVQGQPHSRERFRQWSTEVYNDK